MPNSDKDELLAALKRDHGIDVKALQAAASQQADLTQLTQALVKVLSPQDSLLSLRDSKDEGLTLTDVVNAVAELADKHVRLAGWVNELRRKDAEREADSYVAAQRLYGDQRELYVTLALDDPALVAKLLHEPPGEVTADAS